MMQVQEELVHLITSLGVYKQHLTLPSSDDAAQASLFLPFSTLGLHSSVYMYSKNGRGG